MSVYYKKLDIDCDAQISLLKNYYLDRQQSIKYFFTSVDDEWVNNNYSVLLMPFQKFNITIKRIFIIKCNTTQENAVIHYDYNIDEHPARINLPLFNCQNTKTNFYTSDHEPSAKYLGNGKRYLQIDPKLCKLVDSLCLDCATVLNVKALHQVVVTDPNLYRISATIAFHENIEWLLG